MITNNMIINDNKHYDKDSVVLKRLKVIYVRSSLKKFVLIKSRLKYEEH